MNSNYINSRNLILGIEILRNYADKNFNIYIVKPNTISINGLTRMFSSDINKIKDLGWEFNDSNIATYNKLESI